MKINHLGIIVSNIYNSIKIYQKIGYDQSGEIVVDKIQNNMIVIMTHQDSPNLELIQPIDEKSSVFNFKKNYHHICYEAEQGEDIVQKFMEMRIGKIFTSPIVAPVFENRKVVFACLLNGTFVELML